MTSSAFTGGIFSPQEYQRRLKATQAAIAERGADLALIHQPEHIYYLTGFPASGAGIGVNQVCVVPREGDPAVVLRRLEEQAFLTSSWVKEYVAWADTETTTGALKGVLERHGLADKKIAVEYDSWALTHARLNKIKAALPRAQFVDFSRVLWYMRQRKSAEELAYLRRAADICVKAMNKSIETIQPGLTERDVSNAIRQVFDDEGADSRTSGMIVTSGENVRFVHSGAAKRSLQKGDVVHIEISPSVQNYHSRIMRATVIGEPTAEEKRVAQVIEEAQREAISLMRPGAVARDIDRASREKIEKAGVRGAWETPYNNITGYTLGVILPPWSSDFSRVFLPDQEWVLEEGMVFHIYTYAQGISFSETVHVSADGPDILTKGIERRLYVR